ncbi:MAG: amino acid ABC transporter substrate-binding protein [Rhodobacteraceae bacterium]|nr:amino acid ABC transporter substrate-binding protein [Paracoccaceae bacterium]
MFKIACVILAAVLAVPASAQTLERIKETGELKLGYRTDAAPLSFAEADGKPAGYSPQICVNVAQYIANRFMMEDLNVIFVPVDTSDRFDKVASGEIDLLCGASTITLERRELVDFSVPTYVDGTAVMVPKGYDGGLESFAGKKVGVRAGTTTFDALTGSLADAGIKADIIAFDSHDAGLAAIEASQITAYFADQSILLFLYVSSDLQDTLKLSEEILTIEKQGLALARGDSDFRLVVDAAISEMYFDGTMVEIFKTSLPGISPGVAIQAMYLTSPTN